MVEDSNDEPQYGDRIPYVIIRGEPNARLVDRAVSPEKALDARYVRSSMKHIVIADQTSGISTGRTILQES